MLGGPGVGDPHAGQVGVLGIALGFGLSLLIMAYVIGPISGCHINPAVTLGLLLARKINAAHAVFAVDRSAHRWHRRCGDRLRHRQRSRPASPAGRSPPTSGPATSTASGSTIVVEVVLTALLVMVVLFTTTSNFAPGFGGLVVGLTLTLIHLISIPVDNTSVNPARSIGTALFADDVRRTRWSSCGRSSSSR